MNASNVNLNSNENINTQAPSMNSWYNGIFTYDSLCNLIKKTYIYVIAFFASLIILGFDFYGATIGVFVIGLLQNYFDNVSKEEDKIRDYHVFGDSGGTPRPQIFNQYHPTTNQNRYQQQQLPSSCPNRFNTLPPGFKFRQQNPYQPPIQQQQSIPGAHTIVGGDKGRR